MSGWNSTDDADVLQHIKDGVANLNAPQMSINQRKQPAPTRRSTGVFMQDDHRIAFRVLANKHSFQSDGMSAPELIERAIELLLEEQGTDIQSLLDSIK